MPSDAEKAATKRNAKKGAGGLTALVLSGGGARGAYQVGVLCGLVDAGILRTDRPAFDVIVGSSAGAINAASLAAFADDLAAGLSRMERVWGGIEPQHVFRTDVTSLGRIGARWAWDLSFGGVTGHVRAESLLDTSPLRELLSRRIPLGRIAKNIDARALSALALIATDLHTSNGVVFLDAAPGMPTWTRRRWRVVPGKTRVEHVLASSAIPVFFPSVEIDGCYFGDGSIRNTAPLSPAINLGAEHIVAIGVSGPSPAKVSTAERKRPTIAQVAGVLLDAVMLDAVEVDVEHSERVNTSVMRFPANGDDRGLRVVDVLWLQPSVQVRAIAAELADRIPRVVRYLMRGLGSDEAVTELASYLLFDAEFCGRLMELGRSDVAAEKDRIAEFFARDE